MISDIFQAVFSIILLLLSIILGYYLNSRFSNIKSDIESNRKDTDTNFNTVFSKLEKIKEDIENHKLHTAEKYVTKEEHEKDLQKLIEYMRQGFGSIQESIKSIHRRLDRFEDNIRKELDGKQDKK